MILQIDPASHVPPYEQIRSQITIMAASGVLKTGARLPSIRQLAADLGLAGGTVARAYKELEHTGVISTRGRHGTFIQPMPRTPTSDGEELQAAAKSFVLRVLQIGADPKQAIEHVRLAFKEDGTR